MEDEEMLDVTNESENVETETTEEITDEGIELTDTVDTDETIETNSVEEKEEVKTLKELLKERPEYQEEFEEILKHRSNRKVREYQKELAKYKSAEEVLKRGLGATDITDAEKKLRDFYQGEGIEMPEPTRQGLTDDQTRILARAEADEIIDGGEAEEEANRLASKGYENMNTYEKEVFNKLADYLTKKRKIDELKEIGVKTDLLDSRDFKDFASKFNSNTSIKDIYELYSKTHKQEKIAEKMGSMQNTSTKDNGVKEFYSKEEALKFTREDFDKNPELFKAVERSMYKWK